MVSGFSYENLGATYIIIQPVLTFNLPTSVLLHIMAAGGEAHFICVHKEYPRLSTRQIMISNKNLINEGWYELDHNNNYPISVKMGVLVGSQQLLHP